MTASFNVDAERFALLLGLSMFFGFAFEEFYSDEIPFRPGGVRTFPLLALAGGALYLIDRQSYAPFTVGLLVVGAWIYARVAREAKTETGEPSEGQFIIPISNLLAYILGAVALTQPLWLSIATTVAAVLLLSGKRTLHDLAHRVPRHEVTTLGMFLILVGVILPLLYGLPAIPLTSITPFGVWLAVVAVSSISYVSYLLATYAVPSRGTIVTAFLGGLYSSTATTVVLARRSRDEGMTPELEAGIVAATGMMYVRILAVCWIFNAALGRMLTAPMLILCVATLAVAWMRGRKTKRTQSSATASNPLQIGTALLFAVLMVAMALLTTFVQTHLGSAGVLALSAIVGFTDIDPFVLSLVQGGAAAVGLKTAALAIVVATSSNNVLKAAYSVAFSRRREAWIPALTLVALAVAGIALALVLLR